MSFLKIENVRLVYQSPDREQMAIEDVSFDVERGQFISVVGPSGCGKSTLLSCVAGLSHPTGGRILIEGQEIDGIRQDIGYMFQSDNLLPWRSIYKNALLGLEIQKKLTAENTAYAARLLEKYGLGEFRDSFPSSLSGGMRQRAALIRTLATKPELLLLDEAFSALDYQTRVAVSRDVYSILRDEGQTMLMVTHDIPEAVSMSDRVVVLTRRPARVREIVDIPLGHHRSPLQVRKDALFTDYCNRIWEMMSE